MAGVRARWRGSRGPVGPQKEAESKMRSTDRH